MLTLSHIIHPVKVDQSSDLYIAQPVTFETMRIAREFIKEKTKMDVGLYAVQYHDEARIQLPGCFTRTPDLKRSIADIYSFKKKRKLALMKDILNALYEAGDCDYMIYTNVDIALQPHFYWTVSKLIRQGYDTFIINRRTISGKYVHLEEIPLMYSELGEKHPGWDCFIFKRSLYPRFNLGTACIGTGWIGRIMITNMAALARQFKVFQNLHVTFHIGDERVWKTDEFSDYAEHNKNECRKTLEKFDKKYGPFDRKGYPGKFLTKLKSREGE